MKLNLRRSLMVVAGAALIAGCGGGTPRTQPDTPFTQPAGASARATVTPGPFPAYCYGSADAQGPGDGKGELVRDDAGVQAALAALDTQIDTVFKEKQLPSVAVGVVYDQDLLWARGYGFADVDAQRPATPSTVYRIGSVTKTFTATMLLQLRDAGKLQLDEPLAQYAPEVTLLTPANAWPQPTFRQAASHTAGIPNTFYLEADREAFLQKVATTSLAAEPGSGFAYSNLGFALLGYTMEVIAGEPYRQYVAEHILRPLGMESSGFDAAAAGDRLAIGYAAEGPGQRDPVGPFDLAGGYMAPAGALYSSVDDMAKFVELQFRSGPAGGAQILSGDSLRELRRPNTRLPDADATQFDLKSACYGLGMFLDEEFGHAGFGHRGAVPGYTSQVWIVPDLKLGIIVLANQLDYAPVAEITDMIRGALTPALSQALDGP